MVKRLDVNKNIREKKNKLTLQQDEHMVQVDDVNLSIILDKRRLSFGGHLR